MIAQPFHRALTVLAVMTALVATPALADDHADRTITVSGTGEAAAPPDTASISVGVVTEASEAGAAVTENNAKVETLLKAVRDAGIAERDMQTQSFNVSPRYGRPQPGGTPRIDGYRAANTVAVRVRDLDALGRILDAMIRAGANQMNGVRFFIDKEEELLDEARRRAVADARRKAEIYTRSAGVKLGKVIAIREGAVASPGPLLRTLARASSAESVPVARGEQTLHVTVTVTYGLE